MAGSGCCLVKFLNRDDRDLLKERCGDWKSLQARSVTKKKDDKRVWEDGSCLLGSHGRVYCGV